MESNHRSTRTPDSFVLLMSQVSCQPPVSCQPRCPAGRPYPAACRSLARAIEFSHSRRSEPIFSAAIRAPLTYSGARPRPRRLIGGFPSAQRSCGAICQQRLPIAIHWRLTLQCWRPAGAASCAASGSCRPRPQPRVQERTFRHEKRNADQCLAAGGMPDRDH